MNRESDFSDPGWVWGKHAVGELLRTNPEQAALVLLSSGDRCRKEIEDLCRRRGIPLTVLDRREFNRRIKSPAHQSVAARLKFAYSFTPLEDLLEKTPAATDPPPILLILDHIQDPQNLGAIIRTAYCAGVNGIIVPQDRACPLSGTVRKAASGALEHLPMAQVVNLPRAIDQMKERGFWVVSLDADGPVDIYRVDFNVPLALVLGGEGQGVSPLVLKKSDWVAFIPMAGKLTSLNASVAGGVALFEVRRQRRTMA